MSIKAIDVKDRRKYLASHPFWIGDRLVDPRLNSVTFEGNVTAVENQVMQVLLCLAAESGNPVPREDILQTVWARTTPNDEGLTQAISKLRKLLGDSPDQPHLIQTIRKKGYRLMVPVSAATASHSPQPVSGDPDFSGRTPKHHIRIRIHGSWFLLVGLVLITLLNIWIFL